LGVSGGPDSIALCVLTAGWKTNGLNAGGERGGFIDGVLAIIVDHGLRSESKDEANMVCNRVSQMGIQLCTDILLALLSLYSSFGLIMCIEIRRWIVR
jgi:tRNA(Ile)-lysidine synthase TilS/MesJ